MQDRPTAQEAWCRLITAGPRVLRVQIMRPDGQVLAAYPAERFDAGVIRQMLAGQIRAAVTGPDGVVRLSDLSGAVLFEERLGSPPPA
ncbi:MAG: hypothetical protein ABJC07_07425 [Acidobacteriota bacterium]